MSIWKKKCTDLTIEEVALISLGFGVGTAAITYIAYEPECLRTVGTKISGLWHTIKKKASGLKERS